MKAQKQPSKAKRREFLKLLGLGGVAGAAALAAGGAPPVTPAEAKAAVPGYHETPHVKKYYDTAKF